jgi:hypothetical protein
MSDVEPRYPTGTPVDPELLDLSTQSAADTDWDYLRYTHEAAQRNNTSYTMYEVAGYEVVAFPGDSFREVVRRAKRLRRMNYDLGYRLRNYILEGHLDGSWSLFRLFHWFDDRRSR